MRGLGEVRDVVAWVDNYRDGLAQGKHCLTASMAVSEPSGQSQNCGNKLCMGMPGRLSFILLTLFGLGLRLELASGGCLR